MYKTYMNLLFINSILQEDWHRLKSLSLILVNEWINKHNLGMYEFSSRNRQKKVSLLIEEIIEL